MNTRINALRDYMQKHRLDAIIIPSTDPHQSEYVSDHWKLRAYFSEFTGSAGTLVITKDKAALWTDSRYFLQVEIQCKNNEVELYKQSIPHAPEHIPWLCEELPENSIIGLDFRQFSKAQVDYTLKYASPKNIQIQDSNDFADEVWTDRVALPDFKVEDHEGFSGESRASKIKKIQQRLKERKADYYLFSSLDEIAWLFNIRSRDVDFTPLVTSYALVGKEQTFLFCDIKRFETSLIKSFSELNIEIKDYDTVFNSFSELSKNKIILTDASSLNYAIAIKNEGEWLFENSIVKELKSIKNTIEIEGAKDCMLKDGVALTRFFIWLEKQLKERQISEYEIGRKLESFRKKEAHYIDESFAAIVGYKGNGAIIHYTAPKEGSADVINEGILLVDSGAQYKNGTTDITRTVWLGGEIPTKIRKAYTAVLKGYIELEQLQFPLGTTGMQLDAFARVHLWKNGLNYPHGTGHGIGSFGMVHEPEQGFATSTTTSRGTAKHYANQLTTIEPGCYVTDEFGIRIENIVLSKIVNETEFGQFLGFEALSLCYIDTELIATEMLTQIEKDWLNNYHVKVVEKLSPFLEEEEIIWLKMKCKAL